MKLCVISHKRHWLKDDRPVSSGGFVLEIDYWATMFDEVLLCVPLYKDEEPPRGVYGYRMPNIDIAPLPPFRANLPKRFVWRFRKSYRFLMNVVRFIKMLWAIHRCDAVCVRCPGHASMTGLVAAMFTWKRRCARYGANWASSREDSDSERRQKAILRGWRFRGPVFVQWYSGEHFGDNIFPVFGTTITDADVLATKALVHGRQVGRRPRLLFVGRLSPEKNVDVILSGVAKLKSSKRFDVRLDICGDGGQREHLESLAEKLGLSPNVAFHGMISHEEMHSFYESADILVLASSTEGWPKVLTEAMLYGLPCVATDVGAVPEIVGRHNQRGILWPVGQPDSLAEAVKTLVDAPDLYRSMSRAARAWAEKHSLERYRDEVKAVLEKAWRCELNQVDVAAVGSTGQ